MRRSILTIAAALSVIGLSANAQTDNESSTGFPEQNLSEEAQSLIEEPADESAEAIDEPIVDDNVNVSLGDWDVRTSISERLDLAITDVPLTVAIDPDLASSICPVRESDLAQQEVVSAVRTCAAKSVNDSLLDAVKTGIEQPEARSLDGTPIDPANSPEALEPNAASTGMDEAESNGATPN